jgi:hypothetical protein
MSLGLQYAVINSNIMPKSKPSASIESLWEGRSADCHTSWISTISHSVPMYVDLFPVYGELRGCGVLSNI